MLKTGRILGLLAVTLAAPTTSRADSWAIPKTFQVTSKDGGHRLTVEPSFGDRPSPTTKDATGKAVRPKALGKLEKKSKEGRFEVVWEHALANDVSPVRALVADDGSVVTLDNWHSMGYGPDVVVVFAPDGKLVRSMGLEDFLSKEEVGNLPHSVSSIWWGSGHHLDDKQEFLTLNVGNGGLAPGDRDIPKKTVRVRLKTGEIIKDGAGEPNEAHPDTKPK
ncbi:hypothetical protein TA3x_005587 [Tundrisphaera sp. TA3]|uniref:hypothetical protein n=1 Tax=Tundrisphaera sp. TA3 TaxID=3435775 RepID=UPI003EBCEBDF